MLVELLVGYGGARFATKSSTSPTHHVRNMPVDSRLLPPQRCLLCQKLIDGCQYRRHLIVCNQKLRQIENEVIKSRPPRDEGLPPRQMIDVEYGQAI